MVGSISGSSMSHGSCSHTRSAEMVRSRELNASGRTRRACPSAPQLRRWGQAPFSVDTPIANQNVSLHASASDASARCPSSPNTTSMSPLVRGDAMRRPRAAVVRAPASEGPLEGRSFTNLPASQPESFGPTSHTVDDAHLVNNKSAGTGELSCDAVTHAQHLASASPVAQMPAEALPGAATVPVEAEARTYHVSEPEAVGRGDDESTRTHIREPWMPSSTLRSPAAAVPLQPVAPPPPTPLPVASRSSAPSPSALVLLPQHPREGSNAASREPPSSSSSSQSRLRQVAQATPVRGHSGSQVAEVVQDTSDRSPPIVVCTSSGTPSALIASVSTVAAEEGGRQICEGGARRAASTSGDVVGERDGDLPTVQSNAPLPTRELLDCTNDGRLVTTVADVSAVSPTTRDKRRRRLADAQQSRASVFSSSLPSSPIVSSSCSIARILQLQAQEGWKDGLRAALQQDAEVWVRQVCEEQQLLRAQLSVTQARAAALAKGLQELRDCGSSSASALQSQSQPADTAGVAVCGAAEESCQERTAAERPCNDEGSGKACLSHLEEASPERPAAQEGGGRGAYTSSAADGDTAAAFCTAYTHELEAYAHLLEQHTHALHAEKYQLQLRLDRRTSQLASSQQRYLQRYTRLLQEQSVLERDCRKATEDVEQLVGMLVVARAAERAAMRRVQEIESALGESELRAEALAAALHPQAKENGGGDIEGGTGSVNLISDSIAVGSNGSESLRCPSGYASALPPSSAFASFTEHNETDRSIMLIDALAAASGRPSVERPRVLAWRSMSASSSMYPPLSPSASSLTAESTSWTPVRAQTTAVGREWGGEAEPPWVLSAYSFHAVPLSAEPSPMRTAADVERSGAVGGCSPEVCVAARLAMREAGIPSLPQRAPSQAATAPPALTSLLIADAIASAGTATVASCRPASSQKLSCEDDSDGVSGVTALTVAPVSVEHAGVQKTSISASTNLTSANTCVCTPLISTITTALTPRTLARQRRHVQNQIRELCGGAAEGGDHSTVDEHQLLQLRCTLLELELQAKETAHKAEKEAWEAAVHNAEGIAGAMGEVEARVKQAVAASEKAEYLLHEMSRLWSHSLALDEDDISDDGGEAAASATRLDVMDEEQIFYPRRSRDETPLY
ncbi:conserved hypothetical protein [Leishmania major strain Friedlin]|uniref:Uncharacterized protein n=1 Tax=Leishmania major TaxID=5664 RepID=Q4QBL6_LEIMA|nr:conserved hypothetical protein [Leishmania major strain Friedlin]CAG9573997.1 hypothetical_protein_-_conserved [Leishmania major strain Friedlin]CAJ04667.1 conserved hypothetical protein [Leishmania major strain Friedlin]|eukprot:XP_001683282.1 conserved hypothetical protein [Leishmania major strain Friedlin]